MLPRRYQDRSVTKHLHIRRQIKLSSLSGARSSRELSHGLSLVSWSLGLLWGRALLLTADFRGVERARFRNHCCFLNLLFLPFSGFPLADNLNVYLLI